MIKRISNRIAPAAIASLALFFGVDGISAQTFNGVDVSLIDRTARPCDDFYQFADGTWLKNNPIPADRASWGSFADLQERNRKILHEIVDEAAKVTNAPAGSPLQMVGAFYRSGMDEERINAEGTKPLQPELDRIAAITDADALAGEIARLHRMQLYPAFAFFVRQDFKDSTKNIGWVFQGGLGLPNRDYYFDKDKEEIRVKYAVHIEKIFKIAGEAPEAAAAAAKTVMAMETRLAGVSMTPVELRNPKAIYHPMQLAEFEKAAPGMPWARFFAGIKLAEPGLLNVAQPDFFREQAKMAGDIPLAEWKVYLRWRLLNGTAKSLGGPFEEEDFNFNGKVIRGTQEMEPRWKRVMTMVDDEIGEQLGRLYVERAFPPEAKARAVELVHNLRAALHERIGELEWMESATKAQALKKLDAFAVKIGYPDKWRDYSGLSVDDGPYVSNVLRANEFEFQRDLNKIGKPLDRTEWGMTPPTVNAYYNPSFNEIVFPAGILQPPFFDPKADDASNYGGIGAVIGHEMTHGFDDQGRQFDAQGNLKDWWTPQDSKNFDARADLVVKQFDSFTPIETIHINGKLTLGENIADLGGLRIAYRALQKVIAGEPEEKIEGFTPSQRFFLAYAQVWKINFRPEALKLQLATNPHSPGRFRVLGPLSNIPEFSKAFDCPAPTGASKVTIW